ncbi:MAG: ketose-bisphosphate aldolase [Armatimonadota bacterium]
MPLVTSGELMQDAMARKYAVGGFNAVNMESAQAIFAAAEEMRSPLLLQVTQTTLGYTEPEELVACIKVLIDRSTVPVALHLDHGRSFAVCMRFLRLGFSSIMIDGSLDDTGKGPRTYEENIEVTCKVREAAHALGVSVEAEIGRLGEIGTGAEALTDPDEAAEFVDATGVDLLAVGIGTTHGLYKPGGEPTIETDRVKAIAEKVDVPLVMHGGTGVPDRIVREGIENGIRKINIDTEIRRSFFDAVAGMVDQTRQEHAEAEAAGKAKKYDIRKILAPAREEAQKNLAAKMELFGSAGKA